SCQCAVHTTTSLCLPQWSTCYLMSLQKWDAPLRYRSPITHLQRYTQVETKIGDQIIPQGQLVRAWINSANHDELQFENGDRFIIDRQPNKHLAFGNGIHFCLGAPLARLEAKIALRALLEEFPNLRVDSTQTLKPIPTLLVHGLESLSVLL
ncbi:MAG: cytochrome P450, partial [Nostoc sp.]|uniref:cytochrome P450 n=1 Tax=Nostoc sp. TaxID=1180 RepID=UPI002FF9F486